jgi:predicted protein tyrosine phosphatase
VKLIVCALADLDVQARLHSPAGVVSLLNPDQPATPIPGDPARLVLRFNDIAAPRDRLTAPSLDVIERLLAFAEAAPADGRLLLHCWMGISRSPAAAFILACAGNPSRSEAQIAAALRRVAPSATPNPLMVRLADGRLGRRGRMNAAIAGIGRGKDAAMGAPFALET